MGSTSRRRGIEAIAVLAACAVVAHTADAGDATFKNRSVRTGRLTMTTTPRSLDPSRAAPTSNGIRSVRDARTRLAVEVPQFTPRNVTTAQLQMSLPARQLDPTQAGAVVGDRIRLVERNDLSVSVPEFQPREAVTERLEMTIEQ